MQFGMKRPGPLNRPAAEIDPDAVGGPQGGKHVAAAAAELQHPLAGRNQESREFQIVLAIAGVVLAAKKLFAAGCFGLIEQDPFSLADRLRGAILLWQNSIH